MNREVVIGESEIFDLIEGTLTKIHSPYNFSGGTEIKNVFNLNLKINYMTDSYKTPKVYDIEKEVFKRLFKKFMNIDFEDFVKEHPEYFI